METPIPAPTGHTFPLIYPPLLAVADTSIPTSRLAGCHIPIELYRVIAEAVTDRNTLTALSCVSRTFHYEASRCLYEALCLSDTSWAGIDGGLFHTLASSPLYASFVKYIELEVQTWLSENPKYQEIWCLFRQFAPRLVNLQHVVLHLDVYRFPGAPNDDEDPAYKATMEWDGGFSVSDLLTFPELPSQVTHVMKQNLFNTPPEELAILGPSGAQRGSTSDWSLHAISPMLNVQELFLKCVMPHKFLTQLSPTTLASFARLKRLCVLSTDVSMIWGSGNSASLLLSSYAASLPNLRSLVINLSWVRSIVIVATLELTSNDLGTRSGF
ncbi:hypothetical protein AX16_006082 [Volvariella volvacea WC 439]|nr:hypothetical protein AX16_006082 [Volvariella volvacea WC 439]